MDAVSSASAQNTASAQSEAQLTMLRKARELQEQQAAQLIQSVPEPRKAAAGEAGSTINVFA